MTARIQGAAGREKSGPKGQVTEMIARLRRALGLVLGMLSLSLLLVVLGVYATTRTESLNVTGYISGVILTAAIVFLSFGIITSFLCVMIDAVCIASNMDMRPLTAGRCQYYSSGNSYIYDNFYTSVSCWNLKESCSITVQSGTCYCCDLYDCANGGYLSNYYEFARVQSCEEVYTLYVLIWTLAGLNLVAFFVGILTTAVLGSIKATRSSCSPATKLPEIKTSFPTAPLLTDVNTQPVCPTQSGAMMYFPPEQVQPATLSSPSSSPLYIDSQSSPADLPASLQSPEPLCLKTTISVSP
ncbi:transmembrane protein 255B isoform X1 [Xyrichtys novacula]|uniref:Transmembrane protein 255B isoform X1 n=1 Tax=Xyrichtys novacula TaxID=13765 RepID=A0AAV1FXQ8_XYRNO|nr:transmembrane protein 255B isoform X1 [Xyrichtys novacula]